MRGMRRRTVIAGGLGAAALGCAGAARIAPLTQDRRPTVAFTAWAKADRNTPHRSLNLAAGADRLNAALAAQGSNERVEQIGRAHV